MGKNNRSGSVRTYFCILLSLPVIISLGCSGDKATSPDRVVPVHGEWTLQNPYPCDAHLNDIAMVGDHVWAVGDGGKIIHSTDQGEHWVVQNSSTVEDLRGVCFVDPFHGWAVGDNGTLLHTANGGRYWQSERFQYGNDFTSIAFRDQLTGWIAGRLGSLYTVNGGKLWLESTERASGVCFVNSEIGYLFSTGGVVKLYSSANNSWHMRGQVSYSYSVEDVAFLSPSDGIAIAYNYYDGGVDKVLLDTHDSGATWSESGYLIQEGVADLAFNGQGTAYATDGYVLRSSADTGRSWTRRDFQTGNTVSRSIQFGQSGTGIIVGDNGHVHTSEGAGQNWREISSGFRTNQKDVCAIDSRNAWAIGDEGVRETHDGGQTWELSLQMTWLTAIDFADTKHGCIVSEKDGVWVTVDGGITWNSSPKFTDQYLQYVLLVDTLIGFTGNDLQTWQTIDGGQSWALRESVGPFKSMYSNDGLHVWGVGTEYNPSLWRSKDGGSSWQIVNEHLPYYITSVFFLDTLKGWVATLYTGVHSTSDGGITWTPHAPSGYLDLRDVAFADAQVGWVTGWGGQLYVTEDGGNSWAQCDVATNQFIYSISVVDRFNGWAVGWGGTILHLQ